MKFAIVGGGQLAMMLAEFGSKPDDSFYFIDPNKASCAARCGQLLVADYDDAEALNQLSSSVDVATYEFENVPLSAVRTLAQSIPVYPPISALESCQDRLTEKQLLQKLQIPLAQFAAVNSRTDLLAAIDEIGFPAVLKTRRMGYDGKGQAILRGAEDMERAWHRLGDQALVLEDFVPFQAEASIIAARGLDGHIVFYPMARNVHIDGVLAVSISPYFDSEIQQQAEALAQKLLEHLNYIGVLALELFIHEGQLLVNEIAPRVHNSGHWSIEGSECSQFRNHINAISERQLGSTRPTGLALMLNWVGEIPEQKVLLQQAGSRLHDYGKQPRPGRKLGHTTLIADTLTELSSRLETLQHLEHPAVNAAAGLLRRASSA